LPPTILTEADQLILADRAARSLSTEPRSFVRWAGSKRGLLSHILPFLPDRFGRYYEPFLGSGSLFFLLQPDRATLNDRCAELIDAYRAVKDHAPSVAKMAKAITFDKQTFYEVRANRSQDRVERAAEFLFLNRACFNGLYRVNSTGQFNVPWGAPKTDFVVDQSNLLACQSALAKGGVTLLSDDFEFALSGCRRGDLVFLDPPYVTRHNNNGFIDYNQRLFSWDDQVRLAHVAEKLRGRGARVIVTNALHGDVLELYPNFDAHRIDRASTLASSIEKRSRTSEALLVGRS
jgi:DNA adenine methylase